MDLRGSVRTLRRSLGGLIPEPPAVGAVAVEVSDHERAMIVVGTLTHHLRRVPSALECWDMLAEVVGDTPSLTVGQLQDAIDERNSR